MQRKILMTAKILTFALLPAILLPGCLDNSSKVEDKRAQPKASEDCHDFAVTDAYVRQPAPGQQAVAIYMTIRNDSNAAYTRLKAGSTAFERIELHSMEVRDGVMQMRKVDSIQLKPAKSLSLKPGGMHLMGIGIKTPLKPNDRITLSLCLDSTCRDIELPVKPLL